MKTEQRTTLNHPPVSRDGDNDCKDEQGVFKVCGPSDADSDFEVEDEEGYEDMEDDRENVKVTCLFDDAVFEDVASMLEYVVAKYNFNLVKVQKDLRE